MIRPRAHSRRATASETGGGETIAVGARKVTVTHSERVLFPEDRILKADLVHYYRDVAHWLIPYLARRPLTRQRWPDGIHGLSFFQKEAPRGMPEWIPRTALPSGGKRPIVEYPICDDATALLWFANQATITFHVWMSRVPTVDAPDFLLFDLDPVEGCTMKTLATVALTLRDELASVGLTPLVKTTGGRGMHVVVPLAPGHAYAPCRAFNELVAHRVRDLLPDAVTLERSTVRRPRATVYFDWAQLGMGKTYVPPFVVRARPGAPVATPLAWTEVEELGASRATSPTHELFARWNTRNVPALLAEHGDPWRRPFARGQKLAPAATEARARWRRPSERIP